MKQQNKSILLMIVFAWLLIAGWQVTEHIWLRKAAQVSLKNRAQDISNSLAVVLRSQRRFGGAILQFRLESAMDELVQSDELHSIVLLNSSSNIVAKAGEQTVPINNTLQESGEYWTDQSVAYMNLVDLNVPEDEDINLENPPLVVIPVTEEQASEFRDRRPPPPEDWDRPLDSPSNGAVSRGDDTGEGERRNDGDRRGGRRRMFQQPPPGMSSEDFAAFIQQQGLHGFIIELSTQNYLQTCSRDVWLRFFIMGFATIAAAGLWTAWRNLQKSAVLQLRLVRASEMNTHLREMNVAAAGLAHETRNPLNLVRGMAQLIYKDHQAGNDIREHSMKITEEVDRVTAQLNEFINFSKPREPKLSFVHLNRVIQDVAHTLEPDRVEKQILFELQGDDYYTEADESLLRQLVFNLLINSVQSVSPHGKISVTLYQDKQDGIVCEFRDNGPGIPPENVKKVFQPYFTTNEKGTGLGLTIVHQIVLAHGWEINCQSVKTGALFQIRGILPVNKTES